MSLLDRFKSKRVLALIYKRADMEELLQMELTEFDFVQIRTAWNEQVDKMDLSVVDELIKEWFFDTFSLKLEKKKPQWRK